MRLLMVIVSFWGMSAAALDCFPPTPFSYPAQEELRSGISKTKFNRQLDLVEKFFGDEVKSLGFELQFNRLWEDPTVNSDTTVVGTKWVINSYGGLARFEGMTPDGYLAVACHELGHHLGGMPYYTGNDWPASVEGASDYFATKRCMKIIGLTDERIEKASLVLAGVLASLGGESVPQKATPDKTVVKRTYEGHPKAQCRLDTYLKGLECPQNGPFDATDPKVNSCFDYESKMGVRPLCWFKP